MTPEQHLDQAAQLLTKWRTIEDHEEATAAALAAQAHTAYAIARRSEQVENLEGIIRDVRYLLVDVEARQAEDPNDPFLKASIRPSVPESMDELVAAIRRIIGA